MLNDENTALLNHIPNLLYVENNKVEEMCKLLKNAANPDHLTKKAAESSIAFNISLLLTMADGGAAIDEVAQLHLINRVLCATNPTEETTFYTKWKKLMGSAVPSKRGAIFSLCAKWCTPAPDIEELYRASNALGMFEIVLMSIARYLCKRSLDQVHHWSAS